MSKFLQLMRTGTYSDRHGVSHNITKEVLEKIASTFNPAKPPQITVGHPDRPVFPTFGVIDALKVVGDKLLFKPAKVCAEFAALVRQGGFPGVSAGLSKDLSRLDHVAFLSAQNPAIHGLEPIAEFAANSEEDVAAIDVTESAEGLAEFAAAEGYWVASKLREIVSMFRGLKNRLIEKEGAEAAENLFPEYTLEMLAQDPPELDPAPTSASFSAGAAGAASGDGLPEFDVGMSAPSGAAPNDQAKYNELASKYEEAKRMLVEFSEQIGRLKDENTALSSKVALLEKGKRLAEFAEWVEDQIDAGRILPDRKQATVEMMETLHTASSGVEFSAQDGKLSPLEEYKANIEGTARKVPPLGFAPAPEFAASAQPWSVSVDKLARDYMDEKEAVGATVTATEAVRHVMQNLSPKI